MAAICTVGDLGPACVNLTGVRAGDANQMGLTITSSGAPVNVTGMTFAASARTKSTDNGTAPVVAVITIIDGPNGRLGLRWPGDQVRTWLDGKASRTGVWDLQQVIGGADPVTLVAGAFTAEMDVTR